MTTHSLTLEGVPVYVSGIAGHFCNAHHCALCLHWRIGSFRISTVGLYWSDSRSAFEKIGADRCSETYVFRVVDKPDCPEGHDPTYIGAWVATPSDDSRAAEHLHYAVATEIAKLVRDDDPSDDQIAAVSP